MVDMHARNPKIIIYNFPHFPLKTGKAALPRQLCCMTQRERLTPWIQHDRIEEMTERLSHNRQDTRKVGDPIPVRHKIRRHEPNAKDDDP